MAAVACNHVMVFAEALEGTGIAGPIYQRVPSAAVARFGPLFAYPGTIPNDCIGAVSHGGHGNFAALGRGRFYAGALVSGSR